MFSGFKEDPRVAIICLRNDYPNTIATCFVHYPEKPGYEQYFSISTQNVNQSLWILTTQLLDENPNNSIVYAAVSDIDKKEASIYLTKMNEAGIFCMDFEELPEIVKEKFPINKRENFCMMFSFKSALNKILSEAQPPNEKYI